MPLNSPNLHGQVRLNGSWQTRFSQQPRSSLYERMTSSMQDDPPCWEPARRDPRPFGADLSQSCHSICDTLVCISLIAVIKRRDHVDAHLTVCIALVEHRSFPCQIASSHLSSQRIGRRAHRSPGTICPLERHVKY
jgi:hypothetical protein